MSNKTKTAEEMAKDINDMLLDEGHITEEQYEYFYDEDNERLPTVCFHCKNPHNEIVIGSDYPDDCLPACQDCFDKIMNF